MEIPLWATPGSRPTDAIHDWGYLRIICAIGAVALFVGLFIILGLTSGRITSTVGVLFSICSLMACFAMFFYSVNYYRINAQKIKAAYQRVFVPRRFGAPVIVSTGMDSTTIAQLNSIRRSNALIVH
mgnify:FL=1